MVLYILADQISFLEIQLLQLAGSSSPVLAVNKPIAFLRPQRGFSNMALRKKLTFTSIEPELHVSTPYEFLVSVHTTSFLGFSPTRSYGASERQALERYPASTVLGHHTRALSVDTTLNTLSIFCFPNREINIRATWLPNFRKIEYA